MNGNEDRSKESNKEEAKDGDEERISSTFIIMTLKFLSRSASAAFFSALHTPHPSV